eukprot:gene8159-5688_t
MGPNSAESSCPVIQTKTRALGSTGICVFAVGLLRGGGVEKESRERKTETEEGEVLESGAQSFAVDDYRKRQAGCTMGLWIIVFSVAIDAVPPTFSWRKKKNNNSQRTIHRRAEFEGVSTSNMER